LPVNRGECAIPEPYKLAADQVVQFLITGDRNVITVGVVEKGLADASLCA
jgi:hypothetical protein